MSSVVIAVYRHDTPAMIAMHGDFFQLRALRRIDGVGVLAVTLPRDAITYALQPDLHMVVIRSASGYTSLYGGYLLRRWVREHRDQEAITLYGLCYNSLLGRRIVAYPAGSAQSAKTAPADNLLKAVVRENLGSSAGSGRDLSAYGFSVEPDLGQCGSITAAFAYKRLLDVANQIAEIAYGKNGDQLHWDVTPTDTGWTMEFRTGKNHLATDRRITSSNPLWISPETGALTDVRVDYDRSDEINVVVGGGTGDGSNRITVTVSDTIRVAESAINRCEAFFDGSSYSDTGALTDASKRKLEEGKPKLEVSAKLHETDQLLYGRDFFVGSLLTVHVLGAEYDMLVRSVEIVSDSEKDDVIIDLEAV